MGQQQLLLLVLGIVIVGLAVVAGINAFSENQKRSNKDALVSEAMRIATDVQAWKLKPSEFDGGGGAYPTTLSEVIPSSSGNDYSSPWGIIRWNDTDDELVLIDKQNATIGTIEYVDGKPDFTSSGN